MPTASFNLSDSQGNAKTVTGTFTVSSARSRVWLGVYTDADLLPSDGLGWPNLGLTSEYLQPTQRLTKATQTARFNKGMSINLGRTFKANADDPARPWIADVVAGPGSATYAAGSAALDTYVDDILWASDEAARINPALRVYAAVNPESRKLAVGSPQQVFGDSADPYIMGQFQSEFFRRVNARRGSRTNIRTHTWFMGYRSNPVPDFETRQFAGMCTRANPDLIGLDPYATGGQLSFSDGDWAAGDIAWAKAQPGYAGQGFIFSETGMPKSFGAAKYASLLTNMGDQLRALGVEAAVLFNRSRDNDNTFWDMQAVVDKFRASCAVEAAL